MTEFYRKQNTVLSEAKQETINKPRTLVKKLRIRAEITVDFQYDKRLKELLGTGPVILTRPVIRKEAVGGDLSQAIKEMTDSNQSNFYTVEEILSEVDKIPFTNKEDFKLLLTQGLRNQNDID